MVQVVLHHLGSLTVGNVRLRKEQPVDITDPVILKRLAGNPNVEIDWPVDALIAASTGTSVAQAAQIAPVETEPDNDEDEEDEELAELTDEDGAIEVSDLLVESSDDVLADEEEPNEFGRFDCYLCDEKTGENGLVSRAGLATHIRRIHPDE